MQEIKVRSRRTESRFYIDNEFLNGYAAKVGWKGHIVYSALCRHEKNGIAFPGLRHLARELGVSVSTAQRGIKELVKWNIIQIEKPNKKNLPFTYWLIDYSDWKEIENKTDWYNQSRVLSQKQGVSPQRHPCITTETPRVSPQRQNNTNTNNTNKNNIRLSKERGKPSEYGNKDINKLLSLFKVLLKLETLDGTIKENRRYCFLALRKFKGFKGVKKIIEAAVKNEFWQKNLTDFKTLYYKAEKIKKVGEVVRKYRVIDLT